LGWGFLFVPFRSRVFFFFFFYVYIIYIKSYSSDTILSGFTLQLLTLSLMGVGGAAGTSTGVLTGATGSGTLAGHFGAFALASRT